jgi:hypothetical protein
MSNNMKKISRFFSKQWETFGEDGVLRKCQNFMGNVKKMPRQD